MLQPRPCSRGMYANATGSQKCVACQEGTYQDGEGATACVVCDPGYTCDAGSVMQMATICPEGTFYNGSSDACMDCPKGSWCAGGPPGSLPRPCSKGTTSTPRAAPSAASARGARTRI